jgi:hypothetical protein
MGDGEPLNVRCCMQRATYPLPPAPFGPTSYPVHDPATYILFTSGKPRVKNLNTKYIGGHYAAKIYGRFRVLVVINSEVTFLD